MNEIYRNVSEYHQERRKDENGQWKQKQNLSQQQVRPDDKTIERKIVHKRAEEMRPKGLGVFCLLVLLNKIVTLNAKILFLSKISFRLRRTMLETCFLFTDHCK